MQATKMIPEVLVFRTNIETEPDCRKVGDLLNSVNAIQQWNIDQQDCDHILRIVSSELRPETIVHLLGRAGYFCEELPD